MYYEFQCQFIMSLLSKDFYSYQVLLWSKNKLNLVWYKDTEDLGIDTLQKAKKVVKYNSIRID